ncbi:MAG: flavodoxin [Succinivibrio sp.]
MKAIQALKAAFFAAAAAAAAPAGASPDSAIRTDASGVYISNPTGKPMSEDLKDELESLHEREAASVPVTESLPRGSSRGRKVLVAYFSWGGRTEGIAKSISREIGADLFRIERVPGYSTDYSEVIEQSRRELDANVLPEIKGPLPDASKYDILILGYPAWFYTAPLPVAKFLKSLNLKGKTVMPFMCSWSSRFEVSLPALYVYARDAAFLKGLTLDRNADEKAEVKAWLAKGGF